MSLTYAKQNLTILKKIGYKSKAYDPNTQNAAKIIWQEGYEKNRLSDLDKSEIFSMAPRNFFKKHCMKNKFVIQRKRGDGVVDYLNINLKDNHTNYYSRMTEIHEPISSSDLYSALSKELDEWGHYIRIGKMHIQAIPLDEHLASKLYGVSNFKRRRKK